MVAVHMVVLPRRKESSRSLSRLLMSFLYTKGKGSLLLVGRVLGNRADHVLGSQPAVDSMHSHERGVGLPPPSTKPTATHMHIINLAVGCHFFPPGPQLTLTVIGRHRPTTCRH